MKVYLFPGQGAQFAGMGAKLAQASAQARLMAEEADSILGFSLSKVLFEGSEAELMQTKVTQPAIFLHSLMLWQAQGIDVAPDDYVAGHSLGEFSALAASGALAWQDALRLVAARADAMQAACEEAAGTMAAVMHPDFGLIEQVCSDLQTQGHIVVAANYNNPGQLVISGAVDALAKAGELLKEQKARVIPLKVGGAFHSPLMQSAQDKLQAAIEASNFSQPACAIVQNVDAQASQDVEAIRSKLLRQLTAAVRWQQSMEFLLSQKPEHFIEVGGKGNILLAMLRKIDRQAQGQMLSEESLLS